MRAHILKFIGVASLLLTSGCLPEDVPVKAESSISSSSGSYAGFVGISSAETVGATRVLVKWTPSTDSRVVAYNIYDATFRFNPKLIRTVTAPASQVTLNGLANQSLYSFRVRAADASNVEDSNTEDLKAIPYGGAISSDVLSSTSVKLNFNDGSSADQINVYCREGSSTTWNQVATVRNTTLTSVALEGLTSGTEYTCRAALEIDGFIDNNSKHVVFTPMGQASFITFSTQPGNAPAGQNLPVQPVVVIKDANGNVVTGGPDSTALVTLNFATTSPTGGTVRGTSSVTAVAGVATFTDIKINEAGAKILSAVKADTSTQVFGTASMMVNSNGFNITPGPVSALASTITISPTSPPAEPLIANGSESYTVLITLRDEFGNPIAGTRPSFASNITGDTLSQPVANTNSSGEASGSISTTIADSAPNLRILNISAPAGLSSVIVPAPFKAGPPTKLAFVVQPVNSPAGAMGMSQLQVAVQDSQGNRVLSGTGSVSTVNMSIASNLSGATLSGTVSKDSAAGLVTFSDLGIDKTGTGYRIIASSGSLTPAYSNTFNVTAGVPRKISISGPPNTVSGSCSTAITVQLQDLGNNPSNAIQSTPLTVSGLGAGALYSSNVCGGSALGSQLTFTAGNNTRTVYYKGDKAEGLTILISDSSNVLAAGSLAMTNSPKKIGLLAYAAAPAPPLTPLSVTADQCSTAITLTPMGNNGNPGPTFVATPVKITGLDLTPAKIYSDPACTTLLDPNNVVLPMNSGPIYSTNIYLKSPRAESIYLSVADMSGVLETTTAPQTVNILPSKLHFAGPSTVVAGACSSAFTIQLRDGENNPWTADADVTLTINGIPSTSLGRFYTSASCSGSGSRTTLTLPESSTSLQVYFKSSASDSLNLSISDPSGRMATSQEIAFSVSPSALQITVPIAGSDNTNVCAGPFYVDTLDGVGSRTDAVSNIDADLTGAGVSAAFYSNSSCTTSITSVTFMPGESRKTFYLSGYFPEANLTLTATDRASVLTAASANWTINGAKAWLGTASTDLDVSGNFLWFRQDAKPVASRFDGAFSVYGLNFSPDSKFLYVVDFEGHRILKYDYLNQRYIGWIGRFWNNGGIGVAGSNLPTPSSAQCVSTVNNAALPGWCYGGQTSADGNGSYGALYHPWHIVDDGDYIYVTNYHGHSISRFESTTGAFAGVIGWIYNASGTTAATGGPASCSTTPSSNPTPGWCRGGGIGGNSTGNPMVADGRPRHPTAIAVDDQYIYVANSALLARYDKVSGTFAGWMGMVHTTPTSGAPGCTTRTLDQLTPGWCFGGQAKEANPRSHASQFGGIAYPRTILVVDTELRVLHSDGTIVRYDKTSGAALGLLPSLTYNWLSAYQMTTDGDRYFVADRDRIIKVDPNGLIEGWMGKVANNNSMSGPGCSTLAVNANTPGWCLGGTARPGTDDKSFRDALAIAYDGKGKLLVGQGTGFPGIRRFDLATGAYEGMMSLESIGPRRWSNDATLATERHGFDDYSMYDPQSVHVNGEFLYVAEFSSSRVKKINRRTGELVGWIGAITTVPTGGLAGCLTANPFAASPKWCLGANFLQSAYFWTTSMIDSRSNGIMLNPVGVTSDSTYLYVTDRGLHRISRFDLATGAPAGWIGRIGVTPTGGATGCNGAPVDSFTPGWCTGGRSREGTGDGHLYHPSSIVQVNGVLYVVDSWNQRISSYSAATGAFMGWIGRIGANNPTSGCTYGTNGSYDVSKTGWCFGGTATNGSQNDRGGGFYFWDNRGGITSDGVFLYVANFYNSRVDKIALDGTYVAGFRTRDDIYTNVWSSDPAALGTMRSDCSYPLSLWTDGTSLYGVNAYPCVRTGDSIVTWRASLATGQINGWHGGIDPSLLPNDGDAGCTGATGQTPGWCRGGRTMLGLRLGQFSGVRGSIAGDSHFIYVSDETGNRITRIPK